MLVFPAYPKQQRTFKITAITLFRKREIEQMLANFSCVETAWRDCIYFMENSNNDYVAMFCLTTLEQVCFNFIVNIKSKTCNFLCICIDAMIFKSYLHHQCVEVSLIFFE